LEKAKFKRKLHKSEIMLKWAKILDQEIEQKLYELMEILPSSYQGSRFGHDGLRIEGSQLFIFFILSKLKELYAMENEETRLEIVMHELDLNEVQKPRNIENSHWVLYVRVIDREPQYLVKAHNKETITQ